MLYSEEQKRIARKYESLAFVHINDPVKFKEVMDEFDEIQKEWKVQKAGE